MRKRKIGNELETILVGFAVNKLLTNKYGNRRAHFNKVKARKKKPAQEAHGVVLHRRNYINTYKANSIEGREELRQDLIIQLKRVGKYKNKMCIN